MVESHTKGVDLFTRASTELKNEQLRGFAAKTLPTIKEHLDMAKRLQGEIGRTD
jgi:putative membrane protein